MNRPDYYHDYYLANKDKYLERARQHEVWYRFFTRAAKSEGCVDCGERDPVVLDFDHVGDNKTWTIGKMHARPVRHLINEIAKCEVRCANCHRRVTAQRRAALCA